MIFGTRKREKIRQNIIDNLTLCRLEGDLLAIEAAIRDNEPTAASEDGNIVKRFITGFFNDISNAAKTYNVRELSQDKEKAQNAIGEFRSAHQASDLKISENPESFKKYIDTQLFKNDKDGTRRIAFALVFAIDERNQSYRFPEESLEVVSEILFDDNKKLGKLYNAYKNNFEKIQKPLIGDFEKGFGLGSTIGGIILRSILPLGVTVFATVAGHIVNKRIAYEAFKTMSAGETASTLAFRLTLIEATADLPENKRKDMIDELLTDIGNIRSDAEYKWYVEKENIPECQDKIKTCDLVLARLAKILGI